MSPLSADLLASIDNEQIFKVMAWVFTVLSGVTSIALTIHKFGLTPAKRIALIIGVVCFGLVVVVLVAVPGISPFAGPPSIDKADREQIEALHEFLGSNSGSYRKTDGGWVTVPSPNEVNRTSEFVFTVMHPNGDFDAVYSGGYFDAEIDGQVISCELIDVGKDRVLIVMGEAHEFVELKSDQSENIFKVRKVRVQPRQA